MRKKIIISSSLFLIITMVLLGVEKFIFNQQPFLIDRFSFLMIINLMVSFFMYNGIKKGSDLLYKYRYVCFVVLFFYIIAMNYNTSNISMYNFYIQPNIKSESFDPIWRRPQAIRSDEWGVSTPLKISQIHSNYSINNRLIMGKESRVTFYPKFATKSYYALTSPGLLGYLFLPVSRGVSFDCFFEWLLLVFVSFDFVMLICKDKKKYAFLGAILIGLSPALIWWNSFQIILYGEIAVLSLKKLLDSKKKLHKFFWAVVIGWAGSCYIMTMYPAWMIPYAYVFASIGIWLIVNHFKEKKQLYSLLYLLLSLFVIAILVVPNYVENMEIINIVRKTSYPGTRIETGNSLFALLPFSYIGNIFYSYKDILNPCESAAFICLYPLPMLLSLISVIKGIKTKKVDFLTLFLLIIAILINLYICMDLKTLSKLLLLSMSTTKRAAITLEYINVLLLLRYMSTKEIAGKIIAIKNIILFLVSLLFSFLLLKVYLKTYPDYFGIDMIIMAALYYSFCIGLLFINNTRLNSFFVIGMGLPLIFVAVIIMPVNKGINVIQEKPLAKNVQKIVKSNPNGLWITAEENFTIANYLVANGAPTLNSVNYYPNFDMWDKILHSDEEKNMVNRYAHIQVSLIQSGDNTNVALLQDDLVKLNLSIDDLDILNIDYVVCPMDLKNIKSKHIEFEELYYEDNIGIYKVVKEV